MEPILEELIQTGIASLFDPNPIHFTREHEIGIRPLKKILKDNSPHQEMSRELTRNQFLRGCLAATENEKVEHLLVGFGEHHSSTTYITAVMHVAGGPSNVAIPPSIGAAVQDWMIREHYAEVIVFHNHPINILNILFDNSPLASSMDRNTMLMNLLKPEFAFKALMGGGQVRFYLGENHQVRENTQSKQSNKPASVQSESLRWQKA